MLGLACALPLAGAPALRAQSPLPLAVELRGGMAIPMGEWNEGGDLGTALGVNGQVGFGAFGAYAGWERVEFDLGDFESTTGGADADASAVDQGFRAGVMASFPLRSVSPFVQLGAVLNTTTTRIEAPTGALEIESERALGFEVGAGVAVPLGRTLSFTPGVRYRSHDAEFEGYPEFGEEDISYFLADLGLRIAVGR